MSTFWRQWWKYIVASAVIGAIFAIAGLLMSGVILPFMAWAGDPLAAEMLEENPFSETVVTLAQLSASAFIFFVGLFSLIHVLGNALKYVRSKLHGQN